MKPSIPFLSFAVLMIINSSACLSGPAEPGLTAEQQEIVHLSETLTTAVNERDWPTYRSHLVPGLIGTTDFGWPFELPESLAQMPAPEIFQKEPSLLQLRDRRDVHVRVYGDVGVLNYRVTVVEAFGREEIVSESRMSETFQKRDGAWLMITQGETNIPQNRRAPVKVPQRALEKLVGQYEWRPGMVDTVTLENGHLYSQMSGDPNKREVFSIDENSTIVIDDNGWVSNIRDSTGRITGYAYHRPDGVVLRAKKIK